MSYHEIRSQQAVKFPYIEIDLLLFYRSLIKLLIIPSFAANLRKKLRAHLKREVENLVLNQFATLIRHEICDFKRWTLPKTLVVSQ